MSKYLLDKFLYTVDRDPDLVERYREGALREQDHVTLFEMGAHPFLTLTLFIALFERDHGPLEYQKAYGRAMAHISLPYPEIAT